MIETDDVDDLGHELWVGRQLETVLDVGFEVEPLPDPTDRGRAQAAALGHRGPRPVGGVGRHLLQRRHDNVFDLIEQDRRRPARARLVRQAVQAGGDKPRPPPVHRGHTHPQVRRDLLVRLPLGTGQHDPGPHRQVLRRLRPPRPPVQLGPLRVGQDKLCLRPTGAPLILQTRHPVRSEPRPPHAHGRDADREPLRHSGVRQALRTRQDDPRPPGQSPRPTISRPFQLPALSTRQHNLYRARPRMRHPHMIAT